MNHFTAFFLGVLIGALVVLLIIVSYVEGKKAGRREAACASQDVHGSSGSHSPLYTNQSGYRPSSIVPPTTSYPKVPERPFNPPSSGSAAQDK